MLGEVKQERNQRLLRNLSWPLEITQRANTIECVCARVGQGGVELVRVNIKLVVNFLWQWRKPAAF